MKKIIIASKNPVKARATLSAFRKMFPEEQFEIKTVSVPSGVSDQPMTSRETLLGATNRAENAFKMIKDADYWVGIEGGIEEEDDEMVAFAYIVIKSEELTGKSRSGAFYLPEKISEMIRQGKELGKANDIVFQQKNSKQNHGTIGILTRNVIDRTQLYEHAIILALLPFKNTELYGEGNGQ